MQFEGPANEQLQLVRKKSRHDSGSGSEMMGLVGNMRKLEVQVGQLLKGHYHENIVVAPVFPLQNQFDQVVYILKSRAFFKFGTGN